MLLRIPARGGAGSLILADLQSVPGRAFVTPVASPSGDRLAYIDLVRVDRGDDVCGCAAPQPLLDSAVLRVRAMGARGGVAADPHVGIRFQGTDANHRFTVPGVWYERLFPFQADHSTERAMVFRPSWAPDGERIAYSDGLSILVWRIGDPAATTVPNTSDGVSAAWSPDGQWIAFTSVPRADSIVQPCGCVLPEFALYRTVYQEGPRTVVIIRPDGSDRTDLGAGEDPAWSPDGIDIYARRGNEIVRMPVAGGVAVQVPNTTGGRAPSVSPDGQWLAFSRRKAQLSPDYDIWVIALER